MRGIIKAKRHEECETKNEIKIAGASIADLLKKHEQKLVMLEREYYGRYYGPSVGDTLDMLGERVAALEKRLQDLQKHVDGQAFDRITMLEDTVLEYPPCSEGTNKSLESRVATIERTLKPTE